MDPQETWHLIFDALQRLEQATIDGRRILAAEARTDAVFFLEALARWIQSGGMPPTVD
jgi:hypothetical protein